jgi:single-strand DNA-binding protein
MRSINKVILIGNATRDAELRHTNSGKPVASLRLATNRGTRDRESTQFHTIICWDTLAETTSRYVKKGDPLYVEGRLAYRSFADEEGKERGVTEIVAADVQFLGRKPAAAQGDPATATGADADDLALTDSPF